MTTALFLAGYLGLALLLGRMARRSCLANARVRDPILETSSGDPVVPRMVIVSASMAAGHDGAAAELARRAVAAGYQVDRIDYLDLLPCGTGSILRAAYRAQLKVAPATWGWLLSLAGRRTGSAWAARVPARLASRRLIQSLTPEPTVVVSTYPLASQALSHLRAEGQLSCRAVTFLTDMSVHPLWVAPNIDGHLALHEVPGAQARLLGARDVEVVGPAVRPEFAPGTPQERRVARNIWGLPTDTILALVVAGSWGVGDVSRTVEDLLETRMVTPVVVCGTNTSLFRALGRLPGVVPLGWVEDMPSLMRASDVVVQNSGGLTSLEARQSGLPVITYRCLPGHGLSNAAALEQAGWAPWARSPSELGSLLAHTLTTSAAVSRECRDPAQVLAGASS